MTYDIKNKLACFSITFAILFFGMPLHLQAIHDPSQDHDGLIATDEDCNGRYRPGIDAGTCNSQILCDAHRNHVQTFNVEANCVTGTCVDTTCLDTSCATPPIACATPEDFDCDGISDFNEYNGATDPTDPKNGVPGSGPPDKDMDGVANIAPGNLYNCDTDDDNDGVLDTADPQPLNNNICGLDADGDGCDDCAIGVDGLGPLADNDPTNDGLDTDGDGICDAGETPPSDMDNDGVVDGLDICPAIPNANQIDTDGDTVGDACEHTIGDNDIDGDGILNAADDCPVNPGDYGASCDQICWRNHSGVPGSPVPPTVDGITDGQTVVSGFIHQTDVGWDKAHRVTFGNGTDTPHATFMGLKDKNTPFLYMGFEVNDDALDGQDRIVITLRPDANIGGTSLNTQNQSGDIRLIITPASAPGSVLVSTYSTSWNNIAAPASLLMASASDGEGGWNVEIKMPISNTDSGGAWADFTTHFKYYFDILRFDGGAYTQFVWPENGHDIDDDEGNLVNASLPSYEWGIGTTDTTACSGLSIAYNNIYTGNSTVNSINLMAPNSFFADVQNSSGVSASNVNVTFRIADWGVADKVSANADWRKIPAANPACPNAGFDNNATCNQSVPAGGAQFRLDWTVAAGEQAMYDPGVGGYEHQCILAEIDSTSNTNITQRSARRNMDFDPMASLFERKAKISAGGLRKTPNGADHVFHLREVRKNLGTMKLSELKEKKLKSGALKLQDVSGDDLVSRSKWLVHGYNETGRHVQIRGKKFPIIEVVGSFGYVVSHVGEPVAQWEYGIEGAEEIREGYHRLAVPVGGFREIMTSVRSYEKGELADKGKDDVVVVPDDETRLDKPERWWDRYVDIAKDKLWIVAIIILIILWLLMMIIKKFRN